MKVFMYSDVLHKIMLGKGDRNMKSRLSALIGLVSLLAAVSPASANWCNSNGCSINLTGHLNVLNNWWGVSQGGSSGWEDVWTNGSAQWGADFSWSAGSNQYQVKTYPEVKDGWNWGSSFNGAPFPQQIAWNGSSWIKSTVNSFSQGSATQDTIWDCFYNYNSHPGGGNPNHELEIWLTASINPSGYKYYTTVDGVGYNVYESYGAWPIIAYVPSYTSSRSIDIWDISKDACNHGLMSTSEYLLNIDFGQEIYHGASSINCYQYYAP